MTDLSTLALIAIVIGWIIQFLNVSPKKQNINPLFLIFYSLGSAIIAWDAFQSGGLTNSILNLATFAIPVAILLKINK